MNNKLKTHNEIIIKYQHNEKVLWWLDYDRKSEIEKKAIIAKWTAYYKQCADSPEAALFRETKKALSENNTARVKSLAAQARQMLADGFYRIPQPSKYDPLILKNENEVAQYLRSKQVIDNATQKGVSDLF
jgi:hypothetical protein